MDKYARFRYQPCIPMGSDGRKLTGSPEHTALSRKAAGEGMVLLKNDDNALPLKKDEKVALFGKATIEYIKGGGGSGDVFCAYTHNIYDGFAQKEKEGKISVPTADFRQPACKKQLTKGACTNRQCLFPTPCKNLIADHSDYLALLRKLRKIPKVKKVFIRSGIRFDYVLEDTKSHFLQELADYHVSGQLRVAPEHVSDKVLEKMGKPSHKVYLEFLKQYYACCKKSGKEQYAVPYFMSSHPGCGLKEAVELAEYIRDMGFMPEQVQDFYPTPSTISTCMYYTGLDPRTMEKVYVPVNPHEKNMQRALIQYRRPENRKLVEEALVRAGRQDLIGFGPKCLIRPYDGRRTQKAENLKTQKGHIGNNGKNGRGNQNQQSNGRQQKQHMGKKKTIRNVHKKR